VQKLYDAFTQAFRSADVVVIPHIYAARKESDVGDIDLPMFLRDIRYGSSVTVFGGYTLEEAETFLNEEVLHAGDLLLCMGAGDITGLAERMMTQPPSAAVPTPG
ncbi:hypothetical protein HYT95_03225, partial [Candidatus Peregrinibacteria bacterium]|nr:hypothetical protein [Candidatus Peregrinibacteria bacterium]